MKTEKSKDSRLTRQQKRRLLIIVVCIIVIIAAAAGIKIGWQKTHHISKIQIPKNTKIWMIITANYGVGTRITFLDKDLNVLAKSPELQYSSFSFPPYIPLVRGHVLYTSPEGDMAVGGTHITVSIDMRSGEIREYDNGDEMSGPTSTGVNQKAFYVCTNHNDTSTVSRRDRKTGRMIYRRFDKERMKIMYTIFATDRNVYCTGFVDDEKDPGWLYLLDPDDLSTRKIIRIPGETFYMSEYDGKIYMPFSTGSDTCYIGSVDDATGKFKKIRLKGRKPNAIQKYGRYLITDDTDMNADIKRNSTIMLYDMKTGKEKTYPFEGIIDQTWMDHDTLYVLDDAEEEKSRITVYRLRNGGLKKVRSKVFDSLYSGVCTTNDNQDH
ncbi:MAG: hypothetical protein ACOYJJ_05200 [Anaerovoracaceae bacterium]|jgi:hypothetical protein